MKIRTKCYTKLKALCYKFIEGGGYYNEHRLKMLVTGYFVLEIKHKHLVSKWELKHFNRSSENIIYGI